MRVPQGPDAHPYTLTEPRELVLRALATAADLVGIEVPVRQPLPLRPQDVDEAMKWLTEHDYLDSHGLTTRGNQVAYHLSRADRHHPWFDETRAVAADGSGLVRGTRVRCSCGWGGARNVQGPADLRVPYPPHRGGRGAAERLHAPHARAARCEPKPLPTRDPFAGLPGGGNPDGDDW